jgi:hypothetical protein
MDGRIGASTLSDVGVASVHNWASPTRMSPTVDGADGAEQAIVDAPIRKQAIAIRDSIHISGTRQENEEEELMAGTRSQLQQRAHRGHAGRVADHRDACQVDSGREVMVTP